MTAKNNQIVDEQKTLDHLFGQLADIKRTAPKFFVEFDSTDPLTTTRSELVGLISRAPNDRVKHFLFGQLSARLALSAATGRMLLVSGK